jgi:hypothetical protein
MIMNFCEAGWKEEILEARDEWNRKTGQEFYQPEDALTDFTLQDVYREDAKDRLGPAFYDYPAEVWQTLMNASNDFIGKKIVSIDWTATIQDLIRYLKEGKGIGISGKFPGTEGHFTNLGFLCEEFALINDPRGDHTTGYALRESGYGVKMLIQEFKEIIKCANKRKYPGTFLAFVVQPNLKKQE